ncbi:MAG: cytochrome c oxidase subunit I, partial [Candidatus Dadabacteria bacterium]|nr:cytochrome c oxidase subunit I [Candidatus Dadabacteria bacterium]
MANATAATMSEPSFLEHETGFKSWILTTDHKRIGILYLVSVTFFFLVAGALAIV